MASPDRPGSDTPALDDPTDEQVTDQSVEGEEGAEGKEDESKELTLDVEIDQRSTCERHITVSVSEDDIKRYFDKEFTELMDSPDVRGFRRGHAPRKVVEARYRKDVGEKVKGNLLMDSIAQVNDRDDLSPISEPDFDLESVVLPDDGPMTFEFDLEVRPEFDMPQWKGLKIEKPVREFDDRDVDSSLERSLGQHGQLVPRDDAAEAGDYITTNLTFSHDGQAISSAEEEVLRIRPVLSFHDGQIENFAEVMEGVKAGETRQATATLTDDAPNTALRGKTVTATFEVLEVKRLELPELTAEFLSSLGDFESEADLRDTIRDTLQRQLEYDQHRRARDQVTAALTESAAWDLPPALLERQSERELERAVMELQRSGFSEEDIRAHENRLRQNSQRSTAQALKEHFILERIAEDEEVSDEAKDYDVEIDLIAGQSGETSRRVRARLEKAGGMEVLRNQIIERKVIELILSEATFTEVPYEHEKPQAEAMNRAAGGGEPASDIPEARPEADQAKAETTEPEPEQEAESES